VTPNLAKVTFVVYLAAEQNFVLSGPIDMPGYWIHSETGVPPAPTQRRFSRATGKQNGHVDEQGEREIFGQPFPRLSPSTSKSHHNVMTPDQVLGPCDFARRYTLADGAFTLPIVLGNQINTLTLQHILALPFLGWSGGINWKIIFAKTATMVRAAVIRTGETDTLGWGGEILHDANKDRVLTFGIPFESITAFRETLVVNVAWTEQTFIHLTAYDSTMSMGDLDIDIYQSVADDFSLYHFITPFYFINPTPPLKKKAVATRVVKSPHV
jgi:hypothetical protein